MQPAYLLPAGQGQRGKITRNVIRIMQLTVHTLFSEQASCCVKGKLNFVLFNTQRHARCGRRALQDDKLPAVVTPVMVLSIAGCSGGQQAAAVIAELLSASGDAAIVVWSAAFHESGEQSTFVPCHLPGCAVRADFAQRVACRVIRKPVLTAVAVFQTQQIASRVIVPAAGSSRAVGNAFWHSQRGILPAYLTFQRVAPGLKLSMSVPPQRFPATVGADKRGELSGFVPFPVGDVTFRVLAADKLTKAVISETGYAAGAVGTLRQESLTVPFQYHVTAAGIGDAFRQRFFFIRIVINGGLVERVGFRQQATFQVVSGPRRCSVRVKGLCNTVCAAEPVVAGGAARRVGFGYQTTITVPLAASYGSVRQDNIA